MAEAVAVADPRSGLFDIYRQAQHCCEPAQDDGFAEADNLAGIAPRPTSTVAPIG
ncbi:hypothetical protein [Nocardia sp. NPDC052112]|uniref:hypothetical protein n=1 Tax=Nocardia sp. NPDC052112 TaxID=3155646 RepID=UPI0034323B20